MSLLTILIPLLPLGAGAAVAAAGWRAATAWLAPIIATAVAVAGVVLAVDVLDHGPLTSLDGLVRVDALSAFMVIVIGAVALIATG